MKHLKNILVITAAIIILYSCSPADGNHPGHEYMPDMAHSIAYEANVYTDYYLNTWSEESKVKLKEMSTPRLPVSGTIPRGYTAYQATDAAGFDEVNDMLRGGTRPNAIAITPNGHVPYHYEDTEEERTRASNEIVDNPFPITERGLALGKELYDIHCGICHGEEGNGLGYLVSDDNPNVQYPAAPANFQQDTFYNSNNGRYYHSIMYGKNLMGAYKEKLNYEERWQVIHYIRKLQADALELEYSPEANTFNPAYGTPVAELSEPTAEAITDDELPPMPDPEREPANPMEVPEGEGNIEEGHSGGN